MINKEMYKVIKGGTDKKTENKEKKEWNFVIWNIIKLTVVNKKEKHRSVPKLSGTHK